MTAGTNTANQENQAKAETSRHPVQDYSEAAFGVVSTIAERGATHGDPEVFGQTFAAFLGAYLRPIVAAGRPITVPDAFVVLDLMKSARIAAGGPSAVHFHDKAGYALLGEVHMDRVVTAHKAQHEAALAAEEASMPKAADLDTTVRPEDVAKAVAAYQDEGDEDEPADADMLRWALDPSLDPFADQMDSLENVLRPGVTWEAVEARRKRIVALLRQETDKGTPDASRAWVHYSKLSFPPNA